MAERVRNGMIGLKVWGGRIGDERYLVCDLSQKEAVGRLASKGQVLTLSRFREHWRVTSERKVLDVVSMPSVWSWIEESRGWRKL